jgi:metal-responsive CopG/Arc/MetJ family transcriptional regulator
MDCMSETKQRFTVDLPSDLHRQFKLYCVANGLNMSTVIHELIREYLKKAKKK